MAYKIKPTCIKCGACASMCPVQAISDIGNQYQIDPQKCISCGLCRSVCPVAAPEPEKK